MRKYVEKEALYACLKSLANLCVISSCDATVVKDSLTRKWPDFEDCIQFESSKTEKVDVIVTRNKKDFFDSSINVCTPTEFLDDYFNSLPVV